MKRLIPRQNLSAPHAVSRETFSPNAIGVGANVGAAFIAPTPMALGLNVESLIHDRVRNPNPSPPASLPSKPGRGERSQTRGKAPSRQHPRRGSIIVFAMLALLILSMLGAALLRTVLLSQRQLQRETLHTQAVWLADAGTARAVARLRAAADYTGETWAVPAEQLSAGRTASVRITVSLPPDQPGQTWIAATAEYPSGSPTAIRITKRLTVATR